MPANVESLKLAQNRSHLIIQWKPPRFIGDVSVSYLVNCNESIVEMTTQTTVSFKIGVSSNLLCKVRLFGYKFPTSVLSIAANIENLKSVP